MILALLYNWKLYTAWFWKNTTLIFLMVSLFFRFKLLMVSLLFSGDRTLRLSNRTWSWKGGGGSYGCCRNEAATGYCGSGTAADVSLTCYWRYEKPFFILIPTHSPFSGCIIVEVWSPFIENWLAGFLPLKSWHNCSNLSKYVDTFSMVVRHPTLAIQFTHGQQKPLKVLENFLWWWLFG